MNRLRRPQVGDTWQAHGRFGMVESSRIGTGTVERYRVWTRYTSEGTGTILQMELWERCDMRLVMSWDGDRGGK